MSNTEAPISFTTKVNGDLLTFRSDTVEGFIELAANAASRPEFIIAVNTLHNLGNSDPVAHAVESLGGTVIREEPVNQWEPSTPPAPVTPSAPANPWSPPAAAAPVCDHGQPMKLVPAGVSKRTGKPFKAFYCCANPDREQQCKKTVAV